MTCKLQMHDEEPCVVLLSLLRVLSLNSCVKVKDFIVKINKHINSLIGMFKQKNNVQINMIEHWHAEQLIYIF